MNYQYLEYLRANVTLALANINGGTKGQLDAFQGAALVRTSRFKRNKMRDSTGAIRESDPVKCTETRISKSPMPPILEITFCLSSWRRAVNKLDEAHKAWLLYCYAYDLDYNHQVEICNYVWEQFKPSLSGKRITKKVTARLMQLVWLAAQDTASRFGEILTLDKYTDTALAKLVGVSKSTWSEIYRDHWTMLVSIVERIDREVLLSVSNIRNESRSCNLTS
ncbi:bacteriophage antitermination protein Q [Providencia sneebia]|uniref:Antitermination protein Q n=1 Tax=Providencia sneebia DSM 19967 TaxID=1141660 RepID=K8W6P9_9GAMM|nr:bacteriophage antitermination protein Q [Providencia sneebia]EKT55480.1 antitermination protein Q [Providencia sneebia DSM 19967]EKT55536.1 antitermination protein Q [Providencia sneebia DSM 19967]